jgi:hypothetical protein
MSEPEAHPADGPPVPPTAATAALPSRSARIVAFVAILLGGAAGGFIGWSFVDLQCEGDCGTQNGLGALAGGTLTAVGVGVVTVLALRAMAEWRLMQARGLTEPKRRDLARAHDRPRRTPRVR